MADGWLSQYNRYSASAAINRGKAMLNRGIPYVWGGKSPSGFDCSGFVCYCYDISAGGTASFTGSLPRYGFKDATGTKMQQGDIVFWVQGEGGQQYGHTGIYLKSGQVMQSESGIGPHIGSCYGSFSNHIFRPPEGAGFYPIKWTPS